MGEEYIKEMFIDSRVNYWLAICSDLGNHCEKEKDGKDNQVDDPLKHGGTTRSDRKQTDNQRQGEQQLFFGVETERERFVEENGHGGNSRDGQADGGQYRPKGQVHAGLQAICLCRAIGGQSFG